MTEDGAPLAEIAEMALKAVIPGFADAAVVFVMERLLRDSAVLTAGQDGRDVSGELTVRRILTWFPDRDQDPDLFPPGDAVALATGSPYSQCVRDGKPVVFARPDGQMMDQAGPGGRAVFSRYTGATLALYTDGLVETRTRSFDQGITALQAKLARADGPLDATRDTLISALADEHDDVTLILARIPRPACGPRRRGS